jgi:tetratricopeptide (TPR) repeat protein
MARFLGFALVFLMSSVFLVAQTSSARENCDLEVLVRTDGERSIDAPIEISVFSTTGAVGTSHVVGGGPTKFEVTSGLTYRLKVSGTTIETVTTPYFDINPLESSHTEMVHVKLQSKKLDEESTSGSPTVSVSELNIPKKAAAEMHKGLESYSKGDMERAEAHFEKALVEYPGFARAYYMLGMIAIKGSNSAKARQMFSKAIQTDATFFPAFVDLARMDLQDKNYSGSEALLEKAIAVNPTMPVAVAMLATAEFANNEYAKALADVQRTHALRNHEQYAEVHLMAGKVLRMQNHPQAAIAEFQLFLKEKPDSPLAESVRETLASLKTGQ